MFSILICKVAHFIANSSKCTTVANIDISKWLLQYYSAAAAILRVLGLSMHFVALVGVDGEKVMAFNCGGPAFLLSRDALETDLGPGLVRLVRKVQTSLGRA